MTDAEARTLAEEIIGEVAAGMIGSGAPEAHLARYVISLGDVTDVDDKIRQHLQVIVSIAGHGHENIDDDDLERIEQKGLAIGDLLKKLRAVPPAVTREKLAKAICCSRTCEGANCCQWPANGGRTKCPVRGGGYDDAADAVLALLMGEKK